MSQPVIRVVGLGKEYAIGGREAAGQSLREMLTSEISAPFRRFQRLSGNAAQFMATKGIVVRSLWPWT